MKEVIPAWMQAIYDGYHYAPAVIDGEHLRVSGMVGIRHDLSVPDDSGAQFTQAFENLLTVLREAGAGFEHVVEMTTFHVSLQQHLPAFIEVKDRYIARPYPAWTAIGISELALPGCLVEIRVTARLPK